MPADVFISFKHTNKYPYNYTSHIQKTSQKNFLHDTYEQILYSICALNKTKCLSNKYFSWHRQDHLGVTQLQQKMCKHSLQTQV